MKNKLPKRIKITYVIIHMKSLCIVAAYTNRSLADEIAKQNAQWFVKPVQTFCGKA